MPDPPKPKPKPLKLSEENLFFLRVIFPIGCVILGLCMQLYTYAGYETIEYTAVQLAEPIYDRKYHIHLELME